MEHPLVTHFLNPSPDYASGFECGLLYCKMQMGEREITGVFMTCSHEQIEAIACELGYAIASKTPLNEEYIYLTFRLGYNRNLC